MQPFITFREPLPSGEMGYFILQRAWPHYVGRLITDISEENLVALSIPHHSLWVTFSGVLQGNLLPAQDRVVDELTMVLQAMAEWFYLERVSPHPKKYQRWHFSPQ
jgi:hypothetical protein